MLTTDIKRRLEEIPHFSSSVDLAGYMAVYRVCFGMAVFFFILTLIMFKVETSKDGRAKFQNGWVEQKRSS